jgi:glutathione S-transferase
MAPHAVLREIGCRFDLVRVDVAKGENRAPEYLKLNPNGRVPTLVHGERVLYESAAIVLYLCELHPEAGLMPAVGDKDRHLFLQWLIYFTNTLQEELQHWWHADSYADLKTSQHDVKIVAERRLGAIFSQLDSRLEKGGPHVLGKRFGAADIFLAMLCRWTRQMQKPALAYPSVKRLVDVVTARPAWQAMMQAEGIGWNGPLA